MGMADLMLGTTDLTTMSTATVIGGPGQGAEAAASGRAAWDRWVLVPRAPLPQPRAPHGTGGANHSLGLPALSPGAGYGLSSPSAPLAPSIIFPLVLKPCGIFACSCDFPSPLPLQRKQIHVF